MKIIYSIDRGQDLAKFLKNWKHILPFFCISEEQCILQALKYELLNSKLNERIQYLPREIWPMFKLKF